MEPKISVIVPVYNIEKYLPECLQSIAAQTLEGLQVLLIDDGSQDSSGQICRDFILQHPNFEYYRKENGGTASARNEGLRHARGSYIGFVDSDDYIEPEMFETMYRAATDTDADIVYCKMAGLADYADLPSGTYDAQSIVSVIYPMMLPHTVASGTMRTLDWGNCSRLYRRTLVQGNGIFFYEGSRRCEDFAFSVACTLQARRYTVLDAGELYHYRPSETSKSRHYTKNMWSSIGSLMQYMLQLTGGCEAYDFTAPMHLCVFYFCTTVIRNEMRLQDKKARLDNIELVITDWLCTESLSAIESDGMNKEYATLYRLMKAQNAAGLSRYLGRLAFRKRHITPILDKLLSCPPVKKLYRKIRGK